MPLVSSVIRRLRWIQRRPSLKQSANLLRNIRGYLLHSQQAAPLPSLVKIDISPLCSLACPHCVHANPAGRDRPLLSDQKFGKQDKLSIQQYRHIIDQIKDRALGVSLFYYGDPLAHPDLTDMIRATTAAGLESHITTHFSYRLKAERIHDLVDAGLSHITISVDGATQESFQVTRVRGRLDFVLNNLRLLAGYKKRKGLKSPFIEIQHISFPHHAEDELVQVKAIVDEIGIDAFTTFEGLRFDANGDLYNVVDDDPDRIENGPPLSSSLTPRCHWPHSSTVIRFDGDVIPCCLWRSGRQYVSDKNRDPHVLGNVFDEPLETIWNNEKYKALRRQVWNPRAHSKREAAASFCDGCPRLYEKPGREPSLRHEVDIEFAEKKALGS